MNYLAQYKSLIRNARRRQNGPNPLSKKNGDYIETHHIILKSIMILRKPQCKINPTKRANLMNGFWNIVDMAAREHFEAHWLLWLAYVEIYGDSHPYTIKAMLAVNQFLCRKAHKNADYKILAEEYEVVRKEFSKTQSKRYKGRKGRVYTQADRDAVSGPNSPLYGKRNPNCKQRIREKKYKKKEVKIYRVYHTNGEIKNFNNITKLCRDENYSSCVLTYMAKGKRRIGEPYKDILDFRIFDENGNAYEHFETARENLKKLVEIEEQEKNKRLEKRNQQAWAILKKKLKHKFKSQFSSVAKRFMSGIDKRKRYEITFIDGRVACIYGLKFWARNNGYNARQLFRLLKEEVEFYRDIVKIVKLD